MHSVSLIFVGDRCMQDIARYIVNLLTCYLVRKVATKPSYARVLNIYKNTLNITLENYITVIWSQYGITFSKFLCESIPLRASDFGKLIRVTSKPEETRKIALWYAIRHPASMMIFNSVNVNDESLKQKFQQENSQFVFQWRILEICE